MRCLLVIAVPWLALGSSTADDDVCLQGFAGTEVLVRGGAKTLEGTSSTVAGRNLGYIYPRLVRRNKGKSFY